jgi:shikimate dehydrogenase
MERPARLVLLGHPVAHSLSPAFQNAALRSAGIPLTYEALDVEPRALADAVAALAAERAAGNVTVPHKERVAALCGRLTPLAARVGAVNTFWVEGETLVGDNTDVGGFDVALRALLGGDPRGRVALLGAGGGAAAVLAALERHDAVETALWGRSPERAKALAERFPRTRAVEFLAEAIRDADVVVNATPIGLDGADIPVNPALLRRRAAVMDLAYARGGTPWVRLARARGLRAEDGLRMLVEQGALAFERWFGVAPDREAMWRAVA